MDSKSSLPRVIVESKTYGWHGWQNVRQRHEASSRDVATWFPPTKYLNSVRASQPRISYSTREEWCVRSTRISWSSCCFCFWRWEKDISLLGSILDASDESPFHSSSPSEHGKHLKLGPFPGSSWLLLLLLLSSYFLWKDMSTYEVKLWECAVKIFSTTCNFEPVKKRKRTSRCCVDEFFFDEEENRQDGRKRAYCIKYWSPELIVIAQYLVLCGHLNDIKRTYW